MKKNPQKAIFPLFFLFFSLCSGIENRRDLSKAEIDIQKGEKERLEEVEKVARGSVPGLEVPAVEVIAKTPGETARDTLVNLVDVPKTKVKTRVVEEIGERPEPKTGEKLLARLKKEKKIIAPAYISLGRLKTTAALPLFKKELQSPQTGTHYRSALRGLTLMEDEKARALILEKFADTGSPVAERAEALRALGKIEDQKSRQVIEQAAFSGKNPLEIRLAAVQAMASSGDSEHFVPVLQKLYDASPGKIGLKREVIAARAKLEGLSFEEALQNQREKIWQKRFKAEQNQKPRALKKGPGIPFQARVTRALGSLRQTKNAGRRVAALSSFQGASGQVVFQALRRAYPRLSVRQLQAKARRGLTPGNLRAILNYIYKSYPGTNSRVVALSQVLGISTARARRLYQNWMAGRL